MNKETKLNELNIEKSEDAAFNEAKLEWITPSISSMKINKLTAGIIPIFKDLPLPGFGMTS